MKVSRLKFDFDSNEVVDIVNLKLPTEMFGSFGAADGVYPAYHMNKLHWISVLLPVAPDDVVKLLLKASYEATKTTPQRSNRYDGVNSDKNKDKRKNGHCGFYPQWPKN